MNSTLSSIILRTILVFGPVLRVADEFFDNKLDLAPKRATWQYWLGHVALGLTVRIKASCEV